MKKIVCLAFVLALLSTAVVLGFIRSTVARNNENCDSYGEEKFVLASSKTIWVPDNFTFLVHQSNLLVNPFNFPNTGYLGIVSSENITVRDLKLSGNAEGLLLVQATNTIVDNVSLYRNSVGVFIESSNKITIRYSDIYDNNGSGNIVVMNSRGVNVSNNIIRDSSEEGIVFGASNGVIERNLITNVHTGIMIGLTMGPSDISNNALVGNKRGLYIFSTNQLLVYHNNFLENDVQVSFGTECYDNLWDYGYPPGGNYWNDYNGTDSNGDGIGDNPYVINMDNRDRYPLVVPRAPIPIVFDGTIYPVELKSNSTVSRFQFNATQKMISFNVTGIDDILGFCNLSLPNSLAQDLWHGNFTVLVDGKEPITMNTWTDGTYTFICFTYLHSEHEVIIVPEFPSFLILPLFMIATLLTAIIYKRKQSMQN